MLVERGSLDTALTRLRFASSLGRFLHGRKVLKLSKDGGGESVFTAVKKVRFSVSDGPPFC